MAPLVTAQQFQAPSILGEIQTGLASRQAIQREGRLTREEENRARLQALAEEQAASQLATRQRALGVPEEVPTDETEEQALNRAFAANPAEGAKLLKRVGINTTQQKEDAAAFADSFLQTTDEESKQFLIDERIRKIQARGGDASETILLKDAGQLGKITLAQRDAAMKSMKAAALTALQREQIAGRRAISGAPGADPVQSSRILDDGTVQLVRKSGAVEVKSPEESTKELVKQARRFGAELQGLRKGEREAAGAAIKQSIEAFKKLAPIKKNIKNLNEGIRLIDEGAQTGVIAKRFPSIKTASQELENLQGRLGLDIIADVTFGALSESELAFAKDTALPIGLEGEPLKDWLGRKRDSQKALAESLEEAALFLGEPGKSVPDYIRFKRTQQQPSAQPTAQPAVQVTPLPQGVTEEDIAETMRIHGVTRQQVLDRIGGR
ncbi:hypothetical protein KAR91_09970 [Candidatus Pacearchaeota archaeon]|nr:hypothetical protein [Candidatus Pacearchaeota archaeon]